MKKKSRQTGSRYAGKSDVKNLLFYIKRFFKILLDFIWPQFCLGCHSEGSLCCGFCLNDIILTEPKAIHWPDQQKTYFNDCYCCCDYQNQLVQKLIKNYKYNYLENMAEPLLDILEKQARQIINNKNTIVANVPLHPVKKRQRGFDQTEILAKKLAKRLSLKYSPLIIRVKNNQDQAKLNKIARQQNVRGIFEINKKAAANLTSRGINILLIDDVATTGSTLNQAALALKNDHFQYITCLVLAKNN